MGPLSKLSGQPYMVGELVHKFMRRVYACNSAIHFSSSRMLYALSVGEIS
jgi:hypothetical protein